MTEEKDDNMATMPVPALVAGIREKMSNMDPLNAMVLGVLSGRLMKEYERVEQVEKDAALLAQKLSARITELEAELKHCSIFIRTREKMHPDGIKLFDELLGD